MQMIENNLIVIGKDITDETVLAFLAAIQAYETVAIEKNNAWNQIHKDTRELVFKNYLVCPPRYEFIFQKCLDTVAAIYPKLEDTPRIDYTYVAAISVKQAKAIAANTEKPLAIALGILLGCEASTLANVNNLCTEYAIAQDILLDFGKGLTDLANESVSNKQLLVEMFDSKNENNLEDRIKDVFSSKIVVGYSSFETYLAACLNKPVLEIQLDPLLYKWSSKYYNCITDESKLKELVPKGIQRCLSQISEG
jgi:hypothetical protein